MDSARINPTYARLLRLLLGRLGADADALLGAAGVDPQGLVKSMAPPLDLAAAARVIAAALRVTGRPWLGLELGLAADAASHGALGFAVVSSADVREALHTIARYAPTRTGLLRWQFDDHGDDDGKEGGVLQIDEALPLGSSRLFVLETVLGTIARVLHSACGFVPAGVHVELPWPAPPWRDRYALLGDWSFQFDRRVLRARLPRALLDQPCLSADPAAHEATCRECEETMRALQAESLTERVRQRLRAVDAGDYPTLEALADEWQMSSRTLMRKLQQEGTRFQALLDEARQGAALWYLQHTQASIEEVASRLGYQDTSNFSRTCRRWFGAAPHELRQHGHGASRGPLS